MTDSQGSRTDNQAQADRNREPDLAALVSARICHDLSSPLGAIGNGIELIGANEPASPELALVGDSVNNALARLRLMRLAFGPHAPGQKLSGREAAAALAGVGASGRIRATLDLPEAMARDDARILALLALCCETALAWGGMLEIAAADGGLRLVARATRFNLDPAQWSALAAGRAPETVAPGAVQFALAPRRIIQTGRRLRIEQRPDELRLEL